MICPPCFGKCVLVSTTFPLLGAQEPCSRHVQVLHATTSVTEAMAEDFQLFPAWFLFSVRLGNPSVMPGWEY